MIIDLKDPPASLSPDLMSWVYNGMDNIITYEVYEELKEQIANAPENIGRTYNFSVQKQAAILSMEIIGIRICPIRRSLLIRVIGADLARVRQNFDKLCLATFDRTFNYNSHVQVKQLFYDYFGLPPIKKMNQQGVFAPSVNEEALIALQRYFYAAPFSAHVITLRDLNKQISFLTKIGDNPRVYTSFNVAGTKTGRLSSSFSDFGTGTNVQNIDRRLRAAFIPDPDYVFVNVDLEQADSRNVGAVAYNAFYTDHGPEFAGAYLNACESNDLHSTVARMVWPELLDPHELFYRQDSYRQVSKKLGHATNYGSSPVTLAKRTGVPLDLTRTFQKSYYTAFPVITTWQAWVKEQLPTLTTLYGRRRIFWGRQKDPATLREAYAYTPQSMTAHEIDYALLNAWRKFPFIQLLAQVHDSILFQIPISRLEWLPSILNSMKLTTILAGGRPFTVPLEAKVGYNWGDYDASSNPKGLQKFRGLD